MIPLNDIDRRPCTFPVVTATIILVNAVIWLVEWVGGDPVMLRLALVPASVTSGHDLYTLLTAMFAHAGWLHIILNMIFLWAFGPEIEDVMGRGRYLAFYLLCGLVAILAQVLADPSSTVPNLGASGAIAGVMGGFLITFPQDRIRTLLIIFFFVSVTYVPAILLVGLWFLLQLLSAASSSSQGVEGGVAYLAHVGGFVFGLVAARMFEQQSRLARRCV
jgi:membrane associated rhomboid family serine protease